MPPIAQYVFNGIVTGGILALPAVAFSLLWRVLCFSHFAGSTYLTGGAPTPAVAFSLLWRLLRFPNFAVSTYLTVGAYTALVLNVGAQVPLAMAWLGALAATGAARPPVDAGPFLPGAAP